LNKLLSTTTGAVTPTESQPWSRTLCDQDTQEPSQNVGFAAERRCDRDSIPTPASTVYDGLVGHRAPRCPHRDGRLLPEVVGRALHRVRYGGGIQRDGKICCRQTTHQCLNNETGVGVKSHHIMVTSTWLASPRVPPTTIFAKTMQLEAATKIADSPSTNGKRRRLQVGDERIYVGTSSRLDGTIYSK
jgi:hypothetical protein